MFQWLKSLNRSFCFAILIGLTLIIGCGPAAGTNPGEVPSVDENQGDQTPPADDPPLAEEFVDPPQAEPAEEGGGTGSALGKVFRRIQEEREQEAGQEAEQ